ncbi:MAG: hypothetical protein OXI16_13855 [Chloroflexota bacterium]|nr:hypothetical protein [Chloroflexota bacterium]
MATIRTTDDLLRAARENREFREAFRREILTDELMAVPHDVRELTSVTANIAATCEALNEHAATTNQQLDKIANGISALAQGMVDFKTATEKQFAQVQTSITRIEGSLREQEQAQSSFRGTYAQSVASKEDVEIARKFTGAHGLDSVPIDTTHIGRSTLREWVKAHLETLLAIDLKQSNPLDKFIRPDIIAAITDVTGEDVTPAFFLAVEASYSAEKKDIDKATDNAKIIQAITGLKAYPVVAAARLHRRTLRDDQTRSRLYDDIDEFIKVDNPDTAFWYKVDSDDMRPPEPR